jgi:hypothetical protein
MAIGVEGGFQVDAKDYKIEMDEVLLGMQESGGLGGSLAGITQHTDLFVQQPIVAYARQTGTADLLGHNICCSP